MEGETVQPGAGAAGEVLEVAARVGGDEGTPATTSHGTVHRPVVCDELQLVKPGAEYRERIGLRKP